MIGGAGAALFGQEPEASTGATPTEAAVSARAQQSPVYRLAADRLGSVDASIAQRSKASTGGTDEPALGNRSDLLARNLARYFTINTVPDDLGELQRVLGTAQRTTLDAGRLFLSAASSVAQARGASQIEVPDLERVTHALLPFRTTDNGDLIFFPDSGASSVLLEKWDLQALADTGMVWEVLAELAQGVVAPAVLSGSGLDLVRDAAVLLAETLTNYGLLVFRLAGQVALSETAPAVATRHLREAVKVLRSRADGQPAPIVKTYQPARARAKRSGPPLFEDATDEVGLDFRHRSSEWISQFRRYGPIAPTFSGGGAAAGDVNGDDWPDLVLCGGRGCSLFLNRGGVRFDDQTSESGISIDGEARMPVLADFDNDADLDLFITYARDPNRLFLNDGRGVFVANPSSVLERVGDISGPAIAVDVDNDGLLDIYVGNFGNYLSGDSAWVAQDATNGMPNRLYRNLGVKGSHLEFEDTSERAGVGNTGWAQALSHFDADRDGDQDLYIANDFGRNELYLNKGDGTFESKGLATNSDDAFHGMNVSFTDADGDGRGDIFVTNIWFWAATQRKVTETNTLLLSGAGDGSGQLQGQREGQDNLSYQRSDAAILRDNDSGWAWAGLFFDIENDGDDDLFVANGFTDYMTFAQYRPNPKDPNELFAINNGREPNLMFLNEGGAMPDVLYQDSGAELGDLNSRSAVLLDFDRDGDLDLLVTAFHDRARLLRNVAPRSGAMLQVELVGDPRLHTNRNAIGAQLRLSTDTARTLWRTVSGGEGYLGMSDLPVEFGTGGAQRASLEILWPNGQLQMIDQVPISGRIRIHQGKAALDKLADFQTVVSSP